MGDRIDLDSTGVTALMLQMSIYNILLKLRLTAEFHQSSEQRPNSFVQRILETSAKCCSGAALRTILMARRDWLISRTLL